MSQSQLNSESKYKEPILQYTLDGKFVKEDRYATYQDLDESEPNEEIVLNYDDVNDNDKNKDFFQMEEREV